MKAIIPIVVYLCLFAPLGSVAHPQPKAPANRWEIQKSGVEDDLKAVTFANDKLGWAVGTNGTIVKTTDSGKTWRRVHGDVKGATLDAVLFTSAKIGWAQTGLLGTILHTTDGGETWKKVPLPAPLDAGGFYCKQAAVNSAYFLQYGGYFYRTDNAGQTWQALTNKKYPAAGQGIGNMSFVSLNFGCVAWDGEGCRFAITTDGGKSWQPGELKKEEGYGTYALTQFVDAKTGWLLPQYGSILATTDGGKTWKAQTLGHAAANPLVGLHFMSAKVGHVLTGNSARDAMVRRTMDGGKSWAALVPVKDAPSHVLGLSFPSTKNGWVVGDKGYIGHYHEDEKQ